jgi:type I restriction enzyme M protein
MTPSQFETIEQIENDVWEAADQLRANSKLASSEYMMPVLGLIFLRHASNRFNTATKQIEADKLAGRMPNRSVTKQDYLSRGALWLPESSRWEYLVNPHNVHNDLGNTIVQAMEAIEEHFDPLKGVLPKEYGIFDRDVLDDLLRIFNKEALNTASGDVFGRINEYFLMKFANDQAHDKGEFFTPPSLVQTIVNVIEPEHGIVLDPACGSCGMFVQTSYFIRRLGQDTAKRVAFYGHEKTATTIKIAKMNLAVHALNGDIREANTFYEDPFSLNGKCDFVMANPPFNVDKVDAEKVKSDPRLPFGIPGENKDKKVSNGNFLWISYFWSYLNDKGRAGFVMSSQASSAGHQEMEVRRKIVETGDVDVMISIRNNFFYTRAVPCELWFLDRGKPVNRKNKVLMIDARNIHRKVTRKIFDFSPEQAANICSIIWLYRGQSDRFLDLIKYYFSRVCEESAIIEGKISAFEMTMNEIRKPFYPILEKYRDTDLVVTDSARPLIDPISELNDLYLPYEKDREKLISDLQSFFTKYCKILPVTNEEQHFAKKMFDPIDERVKGLIKQIDLLSKLATRTIEAVSVLTGDELSEAIYERRGISRQIKLLEEQRKDCIEQLRMAVYFHRQIQWLQEHFPDALLRDVTGLVKLADKSEIEISDWNLSPGRYVGVAPQEVDEDFDFEQAMRDIHIELADLNREAVELAAKIQENFEDLGI